MLSKEDFYKACDFVEKHEGFKSNHPNDRGGLTYYGITQTFLDAHGIKKKVSDLTRAESREIYYDYVWVPLKYAFINNLQVAAKVFDMRINMGPTQAHKLAQRAVNELNDEDIKVDGILGKETLAAINSTKSLDLLNSLRAQCVSFYNALAAKDKSQEVFLNGWLRRAMD